MFNPAIGQQIAELDREYAKKRAELAQSFYSQPQGNWGQTAPAPAQNVNWIYVSGMEDARNQIVQPGNTAWMMDNNDSFFYVKSVDGVGKCNFRVFQFAEVQEPVKETATHIDPSLYVQRGEFDALKAQIDQFVGASKKAPVKAKEGENG